MKFKKIIIFGSSGSGNTTTLEYICANIVKTAAMDYGNTVLNGIKVHFFAPSGKERFGFMHEVLSKNVDGAIILIDSTKGITENDLKILNFIKEKKVPEVIFENKQDKGSKNLNIEFYNIPVIPTIATTGHGIKKGLITLFELMNEKTTMINLVISA
ncbi:GTPase domain-containing protein [Methanobacterium oryzae]|uniref:GTPase domain-containing protein n=1 Tax=Methanobacterium oryzae TaxID=69540 RepID=UPI003D25D0E2